jgi:Na+-transporting methylmalonyl-CoA/oxaloacetate decarboxylase gamma subunit
MKSLAVLAIIALLFVPAAYAAAFPAWSEWEVSNGNYVVVEGDAMLVNFSNDSLQISATIENLEKGDRISIPFQYNVSENAVIAGFRVLINGEESISRELIYSGEGYINITVPEDTEKMRMTIMFYVVQGSIHLSLYEGRIISPPKGWESGLLISGVGITVVFLVLGILSAVMYGFEFIEKGSEKEEKKEEEPMMSVEKAASISPEDIVAIAAAIQEYLKGRKVRIISVKPSPWKYYGRMMNMRRWK